MADRDESSSPSPPAPEQADAFQPLPGDLLTGARRGRGWSRERVAQELNLDAATIAALEENKFDLLGAPVFARGHLKKYALLMGLDVSAVLSAYDAVADEIVVPTTTSSAPAPILADASPSRGGGGLRLVLGLLVIAAIGVLVWRVTSNGDAPQPDSERGAASEATEEEAPVMPLIVEPPLTPPGSESGTETQGGTDAMPAADAEMSSQEAPLDGSSSEAAAASVESARPTAPQVSEAEPEVVPETAPGEADAGMVTVDLEFNDDSWVEVRDPAGKRLIYRLGRAGERRSIEGRPPLRVFLGNADGVSIVIDNEPFSIPADRRLGNTARFVIAPDEASASGPQDD